MPLLLAIYASTRAADMAIVPLSAEQKVVFLQMQFNAQHSHYQAHYPQADFDCIVLGEAVVGRLYVDRHSDEIRLMEISLLPEYRQQGIGTCFLRQLIAEAAQAGATLTAHVEDANPARAWYARLGFEEIEERGPYLFLAKPPPIVPRIINTSLEDTNG